jgi:hypothetical protein
MYIETPFKEYSRDRGKESNFTEKKSSSAR